MVSAAFNKPWNRWPSSVSSGSAHITDDPVATCRGGWLPRAGWSEVTRRCVAFCRVIALVAVEQCAPRRPGDVHRALFAVSRGLALGQGDQRISQAG